MKNKKNHVVFGLTTVFCAVVTVSLFIWGAELYDVTTPAKVHLTEMMGAIATVISAFFYFKNDN